MKNKGITFTELVILVATFWIGVAMERYGSAIVDWINGQPASSSPASTSSEHSCENGLLLKNGQPVIQNGVAVRCSST